ncbi:intraflagellar transport protein 70A-like [Sycon ciliatum]|uniref:intraflagellar transport protein 70A-like n=1 Tax=Sycon ciliatum TaxID=27933 RepID=UPI0031F6166B|eukprot:scpid55080/ scgid14036/ Tetratricopeptide repeat protein 30A; Protein fleer
MPVMASNMRVRMPEQGQITSSVYGLIRDGKYRDASTLLLDLRNTCPYSRVSRPALSLLAYCYFQMQEFDDAAECYDQLQEQYPEMVTYKVCYAQALYKSGAISDATQIAHQIATSNKEAEASMPLLLPQLRASIAYASGCCKTTRAELHACPDNIDTTINWGCVLFKEEKYQDSLQLFRRAAEECGKLTPDLKYNLGLCYYKLREHNMATGCVVGIMNTASGQHPEYGIAASNMLTNLADNKPPTDQASVGNTQTLQETHAIEAFNLGAMLVMESKGPAKALAYLRCMPPRSAHELDAVTLHNEAVLNMDAEPVEGFEKLQFLLQQAVCPPETFSNLILLYLKYEYYDLAADVLAENTRETFRLINPTVYRLLEIILVLQSSVEEAFRLLDEMATDLGKEVQRTLRKLKQVQARPGADGAGENPTRKTHPNAPPARVADKASIEDIQNQAAREHEMALKHYGMVVMQQAKIYWDKQNYPALERVFRKAANRCSDMEDFKINVGHTLFVQASDKPVKPDEDVRRYTDAVKFYEPIVKAYYRTPLEIKPIILANLCVCYIMTGHNVEAEEMMILVEKYEEEAAYEEPDKKCYHLCIINMVIGTLYCAKGNFEFGFSRIMKSLEPYNRKLGTETWFYAKRCLIALMESMAKQMFFLRDEIMSEIVLFLTRVEKYGQKIVAHAEHPLEENPMHEGRNTVAYEARYLRALFLTITGLGT